MVLMNRFNGRSTSLVLWDVTQPNMIDILLGRLLSLFLETWTNHNSQLSWKASSALLRAPLSWCQEGGAGEAQWRWFSTATAGHPLWLGLGKWGDMCTQVVMFCRSLQMTRLAAVGPDRVLSLYLTLWLPYAIPSTLSYTVYLTLCLPYLPLSTLHCVCLTLPYLSYTVSVLHYIPYTVNQSQAPVRPSI